MIAGAILKSLGPLGAQLGSVQAVRIVTLSQQATANGTAATTVELPPTPLGCVRFLMRASVRCREAGAVSATARQATIYRDSVNDANVVDSTEAATAAGNDATADLTSWEHVPPGSRLICQWTDAVPAAGSICSFRAQFLEVAFGQEVGGFRGRAAIAVALTEDDDA